MIDKKELLEKIEKERQLWLSYYSEIAMHLYAIAGACFRAKAIYSEDKTKIVPVNDILKVISDTFASVDDDKECLDSIYSTIMNSYEPVRSFVTKELSNMPDVAEKGIEVSEMKPEEALERIANELDAREHISTESLIRLQTLQWVKDIIENDKKEA